MSRNLISNRHTSSERTPARPSLPSPRVWLKSELLDLDNEMRFSSGRSDYDGYSWPLQKFQFRRDFGLPFNSTFDWNVQNAWVLPWQFSRTRLEPCDRRSRANFVIRHIGHWNGDRDRYSTVLSALSRPLRTVGGRPVQQMFALTPFSIIVQYFSASSPEAGGEIVHTEILFFYTFDSFVQEALAQNACAGGATPDMIANAYEHVYANTQPDAVFLRDPAELRLAALTTSEFSWTGIHSHMPPRSLERLGGTAEDRPLRLRETLFQCRLQTHLMVAIAAACHGIASFQHTVDVSPLVAPLPSVPTIGELAPFWLRHPLGAYDHADSCMRLLNSLARHNGADVRLASDGLIISKDRRASGTEVEDSLGSSIPPFGRDDMASGRDTFRFGIFGTAIDDDALTAWYQDVCSRFIQRRGH